MGLLVITLSKNSSDDLITQLSGDGISFVPTVST
jgi:hypothetical protein